MSAHAISCKGHKMEAVATCGTQAPQSVHAASLLRDAACERQRLEAEI